MSLSGFFRNTASVNGICLLIALLGIAWSVYWCLTPINRADKVKEEMSRPLTKLFRAVILGAPGSGKGTISKKIVDRYDLDHIAVGDLFRTHVQSQTDIGKKAKSYMDKGELVPDDVVVSLVLQELEGKKKHWLLDGYPRSKVQADALMKSHAIDIAINIVVPFSIIIDRIKGRWIHLPSGRVYNTDFKPPKVTGIDDITGEPLVQREDDKPESLERRLNLYNETSEPILEVFKKHGVLEEFHGTTSLEIWNKLHKVLDQKIPAKS